MTLCLSAFMTIQYFFDPYPPLLIPSSNTIALAAIGAGAAVAFILFIVARTLKHDPPRKRFLMRLVNWGAISTLVVLLLYFFRQQRVYLLSTPVIAIVALLGLLGWLGKLVRFNLRRMREDEKDRQLQEMKKKYLG